MFTHREESRSKRFGYVFRHWSMKPPISISPNSLFGGMG